MAKKKTAEQATKKSMSIDEGFRSIAKAAAEAKQKSSFFVAAQEAESWKYVDFIDLTKKRPCLPLEYLYGTRGFLIGRIVKYDSNEAAGKSSVILMNIGMAQATRQVWPCLIETEKAVPPPDYIHSLGCDPQKLFLAQPDRVDECIDVIEQFVRTIREGVDPGKKYPIYLAIDSVSGLGVKDNTLEASKEDEKGGGGVGYHAREFSKFFREDYKLCEAQDAVIFAAAQLKSSIDGGGGFNDGPRTTTLAAKPFEFHATWRVRLWHSGYKDKDTGEYMGELISMLTEKNKLAPKNRLIKFLLRRPELVKSGETVWDFTDANMELLTGPACPWDEKEFHAGGGWYSHAALNGGKNMRKEDFLDAFYADPVLLNQVRTKLRIRGFGFPFETQYGIETEEQPDDGAAPTDPTGGVSAAAGSAAG
jgi:RecA/RadA recombinase